MRYAIALMVLLCGCSVKDRQYTLFLESDDLYMINLKDEHCVQSGLIVDKEKMIEYFKNCDVQRIRKLDVQRIRKLNEREMKMWVPEKPKNGRRY